MLNSSISLLSPAKLNLFLHITGQRPDGYHNLQTLFQLLDYGDDMTFEVIESNSIELLTPIPDVPYDTNLIVRAAKLLLPYRNHTKGAAISITKRLPMGGGIGGGSSNAATTLVALNHLWQCGLSKLQLQKLALVLGADVPVFIFAQTAWAEGIGEELQAIETQTKWFLVVQPDCHVSTQKIFSNKCLTRNTLPIKVAAFLEQDSKNDCEALVRSLYPAVDNALNELQKFDCNARMTGTGACCFASFDSVEFAASVKAQLPKDLPSFIAKGVNHSSLYELLPA